MDNNVTREHNRYNGENIKQADVNLLAYPLKTITDI
jgi:protein-glucosylgalactosylhydroxylysine glucosidase